MSKDKIETLYRILIHGVELTDKKLREYGFADGEIRTLVDDGVIELKDNGKYKLICIDNFRMYGVKLLKENQSRAAQICFEKCYELAPNDINVCLQALLSAIKRKDYASAFKIFANLEKISPEENIANNNLYLYLLSFITDFPEEYVLKLKNLQSDDLLLPGVKGNGAENKVRKAILRSKFVFAHQKLIYMISNQKDYSVEYALIKVLLDQTICLEREFKSDILNSVKTKEYSKVIGILKDRQQRRNLSIFEKYVLLITEAIVNLQNTRTVPIKTVYTTDDFYQALVGNNFKLALAINEEFMNRTKGDKENDAINILLLEINKLIINLKCESGLPGASDNKLEELWLQYDFELDKIAKDISMAEEIAYYISSEISNDNVMIEDAIKKIGLRPEISLMVKLVYARDYYIEATEEKILMGDSLLQEVERNEVKSVKVLQFLNLVKEYRDVAVYMIEFRNDTKKKVRK